jgi:hypothetical protein
MRCIKVLSVPPVRLEICLLVLGKRFGTSMMRRNLLCRANWQLATEIVNCFQMPDEPMETFLNKINEICARIVTDPGDDSSGQRSY